MFEEKNALPGSELHVGIRHGNHFARPGERHPDVRRAVVGSFVVMLVIRVLRHEPFEKILEIPARGWRGVLHEDETATRMLNEYRHGARDNAASLYDLLNLVGDFVGSLAFGADFELLAADAHGRAAR